MYNLKVSLPQSIPEHFGVSSDLTPWSGAYTRTKHGLTPTRPRATYGGIPQVLKPLSPEASGLDAATGLYMLAFDLPTPSLYVGIAAEGGSAEGVLRRLRKHCIKAMGSHVGASDSSTGGVHHPRQWCAYAQDRHSARDGQPDDLGDARFVVARVVEGNSKPVLEAFESMICRNAEGVLDGICERLWPGGRAKDVRLLTSGMRRRHLAMDFRIHLWPKAPPLA